MLSLLFTMFVGCSFFSSEEDAETDPETTPTEPALDIGVTKHAVMGRKPDDAPKAKLASNSCEDIADGGANQNECITDTISCGQTIIGHTEGGPTTGFSTRFYEKFFCTPATTRHDKAGERVYELKLPDKKMKATVWLETPCKDLDIAALIHNEDTCPTENDSIRRCEMWPKKGTDWEKLELVNDKESRWLLIVEGKEENAPFAIHVECQDGF